ncbi:FtsK/SpoIIIE family DNA translocase [Limoniibacter endophyticus]|uniref:DNA translocase FtsK n=1 Tax=Limoniibacter endophyticus TaxID=1565040 RepID=A0A8J3DI49_9HYPH|nr:DNA translocase FtsK [Limoniibacter endophyticus]GHC73998.1 DNA translocase FtsK [Limoniibacter endophyticus]
MRSATPIAHDETGYGIKAFFLRQAGRLSGLGLFGLIALGVASLGTWNVADPSFSHATDNPISNAVGYPGAVFSDLAMQFFGIGSLMLLVPAVAWAYLFFAARGVDRKPMRILSWLGGAILAAAIAGCVTPPPSWPLPTGLGGVFGDMVLKLPALFIGRYPTGLVASVIAAFLLAPALYLLIFASGMIGQREPEAKVARKAAVQEEEDDFDEDEEDEGNAFIGLMTHWWLSVSASVRRTLKLNRKSSAGLGRRAASEEYYEDFEDAVEDNYIEVEPEQPARPARAATYPVQGHEPRIRVEPDFDDGYSRLAESELDFDLDDERPEPGRSGLLAINPRGDMPNPRASSANAYNIDQDDDYDDEPPFDLVDEPAMERRAEVRQVPTRGPQAVRAAELSAAQRAGAGANRVATPPPAPKPSVRVQREAQASFITPDGFELPSLHFLTEPKSIARDPLLSQDALEQNARLLEGVLEDFGVKGEIIQVRPGPVVTLYELEPAPGIKSSRVIGLADDIARSMSAIAARVAVVPGRNAIGIELPNAKRETVYLREILASKDFDTSKAKLAIGLGKTINGDSVIADLAKMPHLLVAGTTGSGKSVAINTMILSLLYRMTPEQCRLIMIDPKMLELSVYDGIPHLLTPVVTDPKKAVVALKWTVREMEDRYRKMSKVGVRNVEGFNQKVKLAQQKGETITRTVQTGFDRETGEAIYETEDLDLEPMPFIVVIIDEMADLMMVAGKDIEGTVQRLAQMARAAGIHVIMATQRPSVDVITGTIKANFPTRISFQVTSKIDSRTILSEQGAEQLLGMGDMLYMAGGGRITRVHGPFVSDEEVEQVVAHLKVQGVPQYLDAVTEDDGEDDGGNSGSGGGNSGNMDDSDDPYDKAVAIVLRDGKASTSYIQRRLGIGYNRAASIIERMEQEGVIGPANHAGKREILVPTEQDHI